MPDDFVLNVRQIASYPSSGVAATDSVLIQRGLGGPYLAPSALAFVQGAVEAGGPLSVGFGFPTPAAASVIGCEWASFDGIGSNIYLDSTGAQFRNLGGGYGSYFNLRTAYGNGQVEWGITEPASPGQPVSLIQTMVLGPLGNLQLNFGTLTVAVNPTSPMEVATAQWVESVAANVMASTVWSFNGRRGNILLSLSDVMGAGGAPLFSPRFGGSPRAETPDPCSHSTRLATTAFVHRNAVIYINRLLRDHPFVFSFNGRTGDVTLQASDLVGMSDVFNDVQLTGTPTAPTAPIDTATDQIATTQFVANAISDAGDVFAPIDSPTFTGYVSGPTAPPGSSTGQLATTAFVQAAITAATAGVATFNGRTGEVTLEAGDITGAGGALLYSPAFTNNPTAPTQAPGTSNQTLATTAFVMQAVTGGVEAVASFNGRTGAVTLTTGDVTGAGGAPIASPTFTGVPAGPTASAGTATTQLATTAFVTAAIAAAGGVTSFNGRGGAVTLTSADVSAAGGLVNPSTALTGVPTAPTAAPGTNTNQLATTAFVQAELLTTGGVDSFNGRAGSVVLTSADLNVAGGPFLQTAGGAVTGPLTAPTPAVGDNSTNVATTAWVQTFAAPRQNRNRLLNGSFNVDQWNNFGGVVPTSGQFVCDRWRAAGQSPASGRYSTQAAIIGTSLNSQSFRCLNLQQAGTVTTGAATDAQAIVQALEWQNVGDLRWGTPYAKPIVLSFWSQLSSFPTAGGTFTMSGSIRNNGSTRTYPFSWPITVPAGGGSSGWVYTAITIPGDQAPAYFGGASLPTDGFLYLTFDVGSGANLRGPVNQWVSGNYYGVSGAVGPANVGSAQAILQLANVQLEAGSTATPFDWKSSASDYIDCQRYYYASLPNIIWSGNTSVGSGYFMYVPFNQTMRVAPTIVTTNTQANNGFPTTPPNVGVVDTNGFRCSLTASAGQGGSYFTFGFTANAEI